MKKIYALLCAASAFNFAFGQFTLTSNMNAVAGETYTIVAADTNMNPYPTGTNYIWNFSTLITSGTGSTTTFVNPSSTPYYSSFSTSTNASKDGGNNYGYYTMNSTGYTMDGVANGAGTIIDYSDPQKMFTYPFTYNSTVNDNVAASFFSGVSFTRSGTSTTVGDGYGTLILPSGTYNNVLRIKLTQDLQDVSSYGNYYYYYETFYWFSGLDKNPLLSVNVLNTTGLYESYSKAVYVNSVVSGIYTPSFLSEKISLFPNPAADNASLSFALENSAAIRISLVNLLGEEIIELRNEEMSPGSYREQIDLSTLDPGIYFIKIYSEGRMEAEKLVVQ